MEDFRATYRILKALRDAMDTGEPDMSVLTPEALDVSEARLNALWAMLADNGYVGGVHVGRYVSDPAPRVSLSRPEITLKGLEYLEENSLMRKAASLARGVADLIP